MQYNTPPTTSQRNHIKVGEICQPSNQNQRGVGGGGDGWNGVHIVWEPGLYNVYSYRYIGISSIKMYTVNTIWPKLSPRSPSEPSLIIKLTHYMSPSLIISNNHKTLYNLEGGRNMQVGLKISSMHCKNFITLPLSTCNLVFF